MDANHTGWRPSWGRCVRFFAPLSRRSTASFLLRALALLSTVTPTAIVRADVAHRTLDATKLPRTPVPKGKELRQRPTSSRAQAHELPSHDAVVALVNERGFACSGVVVHERAVLSARHCLGARYAVFGADVAAMRAQRRIVRAEGAPNRAFDLALFVLDAPAPVAAYPVHTPSVPPASLRVVGFGCTDAECRARPGRRSFFDVRTRPGDWGCDRAASARTGCISGYELVLTRAQAADTCTGDSGGAVLERTPKGWAVVAITSRAVSDSVLPCGDGGIYVRLSAHKEWIDRELKKL